MEEFSILERTWRNGDDVRFIGEVEGMCSNEEMNRREIQGSISKLEPNDPTTGKTLAVSCYERIAVGDDNRRASNIRHPIALQRTLNYLMVNILDKWRKDESLTSFQTSEFVTDRFRAIIQEIHVQRIMNRATVQMLERMARYYILTGFRNRNIKEFESKLHFNQLQNILMTLKKAYVSVPKGEEPCENEGEFLSYFLLLNYQQFYLLLMDVPSRVSGSHFLIESIGFFTDHQKGNYIHFLKRAKELENSLMGYLVSLFILPLVRKEILEILNVACKRIPLPVDNLIDYLSVDEEEVEKLLGNLTNLKSDSNGSVTLNGKPITISLDLWKSLSSKWLTAPNSDFETCIKLNPNLKGI